MAYNLPLKTLHPNVEWIQEHPWSKYEAEMQKT